MVQEDTLKEPMKAMGYEVSRLRTRSTTIRKHVRYVTTASHINTTEKSSGLSRGGRGSSRSSTSITLPMHSSCAWAASKRVQCTKCSIVQGEKKEMSLLCNGEAVFHFHPSWGLRKHPNVRKLSSNPRWLQCNTRPRWQLIFNTLCKQPLLLLTPESLITLFSKSNHVKNRFSSDTLYFLNGWLQF